MAFEDIPDPPWIKMHHSPPLIPPFGSRKVPTMNVRHGLANPSPYKRSSYFHRDLRLACGFEEEARMNFDKWLYVVPSNLLSVILSY